MKRWHLTEQPFADGLTQAVFEYLSAKGDRSTLTGYSAHPPFARTDLAEALDDLAQAADEAARELRGETKTAPGSRAPDATSDVYLVENELSRGGAWLGAAREWLTWKVSDRLKWASAEPVTIAFNRFEEFAIRVAVAAVSKERQERARESVQLREAWEGQRAQKENKRLKEALRELLRTKELLDTAPRGAVGAEMIVSRAWREAWERAREALEKAT